MKQFDRRGFLQLSSVAVAAAIAQPSQAAPPNPLTVERKGNSTYFTTSSYSIEYKSREDSLTISDAAHNVVVRFPLQPVVRIAMGESRTSLKCAAQPIDIHGNQLTAIYRDESNKANVTLKLRFEPEAIWFEPIIVESETAFDIVSINYFASREDAHPAMNAGYWTIPGISSADAIDAIQPSAAGTNTLFSLGHTPVSREGATHQLWGLPVHYFSVFSRHGSHTGSHGMFANNRSQVMTCGLAELPNADVQMLIRGGNASVTLDYRSDIWHHTHTPGRLTLGAAWVMVFAPDTHASVCAYYQQLLKSGKVKRRTLTAKQADTAFASEFCTWGAEMARNRAAANFDQATDADLYREMKSARLKAQMFSVDAKWEPTFGTLQHDEKRFPAFDKFLDQVRSDGYKVGIWSAFMRCQQPELIGLTEQHMLQTPEGKPYKTKQWFLLDFTQPEVQRVMAERAKNFMRRYKPDMVKFDWGYELPIASAGAPKDKSFMGERMLKPSLDVMITAMREVNPDVVFMYYQLSPLFTEYFEIHSTDDLYANPGDYDVEANRRIFFASALTTLGVTVYGSGGYDWASAPPVWFDSVASGSLGAIADPANDELAQGLTPELVALFNGLTVASRPATDFRVIPYPTVRPESSTRGGHARSWARLEGDQITVIAQRPRTMDEGDSLVMKQAQLPAGHSQYESYVHGSIPAVVSSLTDQQIDRAPRLAVVAIGEGRIGIARRRDSSATIATHLLGGETLRARSKVVEGWLALDIARTVHGNPVEWTEVLFEDAKPSRAKG